MEYLKNSGGFFHDCAVHDLDMICWILNEYPTTVYAIGTANDNRFKEMNDVDTAVITLNFASGIIGVIEISRFSEFGYDQRLEVNQFLNWNCVFLFVEKSKGKDFATFNYLIKVHGQKGMLSSNFQFENSVEAFTKDGKNDGLLKYSFNTRYAQSYVEALETFIDAIATRKAFEISKRSTVRVSEIANACEESIKLKQVVEIRYTEEWTKQKKKKRKKQ